MGDLACKHRDVSCCASCAAAHCEIVDVCGQHFWIADEAERADLMATHIPDEIRAEIIGRIPGAKQAIASLIDHVQNKTRGASWAYVLEELREAHLALHGVETWAKKKAGGK